MFFFLRVLFFFAAHPPKKNNNNYNRPFRHEEWRRLDRVYAIHGFNASTELTCIDNVTEHVQPNAFPILPSLLSLDAAGRQALLRTKHKLLLSRREIDDMAGAHIARFNLNEYQAACLRRFARMLPSMDAGADTEDNGILLVHGVYGSGKSFLVAVAILFLTEVFNKSDSFEEQVRVERVVLFFLFAFLCAFLCVLSD